MVTLGNMKFWIMTLGILTLDTIAVIATTLSIITLGIMTFDTTTLSVTFRLPPFTL